MDTRKEKKLEKKRNFKKATKRENTLVEINLNFY